MLDTLRKNASGWLVKILLGLLIIAFAAWGVGDIFRGFGRQKFAEVGGREITPAEFERSYQNQLSLISRQLGRHLTTSEARSLGLHQRVLQNLVGSTAIAIHADKLGLGISEKTVIDDITGYPAFQGADGKFDRKRFIQVLYDSGLSEAGFVSLHRQEMIRDQVTRTLGEGVYVPRTLVDAVNHFQNDQRVLKYFILTAEAAGKIEAPGEDVLKKYYEEHKSDFTAPEFRKISLIVVSSDTLKDAIPITDEEIKASYEASKKKYAVPEKRSIEQLIFKDKADAEDAARKLAKGAEFLKLGKELGLKEADIKLGAFTREKLADPKIAEAAFALKKNKPSAVVEGFSPVILRVTEITPGSQRALDEVKEEVRTALLKGRATQEIGKLYDKIEDARAGGKTLAEIAKELKLKYEEPVLDRQGRAMTGEPLESLNKLQPVIKLTFDSDVGVENNPVSLPDGYAFVDVREVIPERQKPFDEVKDEVRKRWTDAEITRRLDKKSDELLAQANAGESIEKLAKSAGAKVTQTPPLKRGSAQPGLPLTAIAQAFALADKGFGSARTPDRKSRAIFQVVAIKPAPPLDEKQAVKLAAEIQSGMTNDALAQYVNGLQNAYGVSINTKAIPGLSDQ